MEYKYPPVPAGAVLGKRYKTRFGNQPLVERNVAAVVEHLALFEVGTKFTEALYKPGELPYYGHRLTLACLVAAHEYMWERVKKYAEANGIKNPVQGQITLTGFFRPLGTTWGTGTYGDLYGCIDSTDNYGHWIMAVDISRKRTAKSFYPKLARSSVDKCMKKAGLVRPFPDESWHWRPAKALRDAYARGELEV